MGNYNIEDIKVLGFRDASRKRVEMYLGSADNHGAIQAVREIITNSIDEYLMGHGKKVTVTLHKDNSISVEDEGRGIPFGIREDGRESLEIAHTEAHSGGKFDDGSYKSVGGLNGIGLTVVAMTSSFLKTTSRRNGKQCTVIMEDGYTKEIINEKAKRKGSGTTVTFKSSPEVFHLESINISFKEVKDMCEMLSFLSRGLKFVLINEKTKEKVTYLAKDGLADLIRAKAKKPIHKNPAYIYSKEDDLEIEVAFQWTKGYEKSYVFTNNLENPEGGTSLTGAKTALTRLMKKNVSKELNGDTARTGLVYAVSVRVPDPSFANQTKTRVNNPELNGLAQRAIASAMDKFILDHPQEFDEVSEYLLREQKAEAAANRARQQVLNMTKDVRDAGKKKMFDINKLSDPEKLGEEAILLLTEGDSAGSSMMRARDINKYGVLRLRGKIINALTNPMEKVLENQEVGLILRAVGLDIQNYSKSKLRYGKVAICVDADADGKAIATLVMALFHKLAPEFLEEGRLYWLHAPLFRVTQGKNATYYYSDKELSQAKPVSGSIQTRYKGLGELNESDVRATMFGQDQRLEQLVWSPEAAIRIEELMGPEVSFRKEFVFSEIDFANYGEM